MPSPVALDRNQTQALAEEINTVFASHLEPFPACREIARLLGAQVRADGSLQLLHWVPELNELLNSGGRFELEIMTPPDDFRFQDLADGRQHELELKRVRLPMQPLQDLLAGVYTGVRTGSRHTAGALYWIIYTDPTGREHIVRDPLACSMPLGVYAPCEVYDIESMLRARRDAEYFTTHYKTIFPDGSYRACDIGSTLEIHPNSATAEGTLASLTRRYREIGEKLRAAINRGDRDIYAELTAEELAFIGYDSIELMPEVPQGERVRSGTGEFFVVESTAPDEAGGDATLTATVKKPNINSWGYDVVIYGTAAVSPSMLESCRPDEFLEFIETLHTMPDRPIQLALDSVLGHADFQGALLLRTFERDTGEDLKYMHSAYLAGPNMYGRDVAYGHPMVRAVLLEMYRRKNDFGVDAVRVDGGQDFVKDLDDLTGLKIQDDEFLNEISTVVQDVAGIKRRLDINIEDGRPWPDDLNWIYNSAYLCHVWERTLPYQDRVKQWSPLIFAHNVLAKFKWFFTKWDRYKDVFKEGADWITGNSTHDNARYFYRMVSPRPGKEYRPGQRLDEYYNDQLGAGMKEVAHNGLDNGALTALNLGFLPGSPMFFLNATAHTPWLFFRDVADEFDVKIAADEGARFLAWYVDDTIYEHDRNFTRLKKLGFQHRKDLLSTPRAPEHGTKFLELLYAKCLKIKTDPMAFLYLYDTVDDLGGYLSAEDLDCKAECLLSPKTEADRALVARLQERIAADRDESNRKLEFAKDMIDRSIEQLEREQGEAAEDQLPLLEEQLSKLAVLRRLKQRRNDEALRLLIEHAAMQDEYNLETWSADAALRKTAPRALRAALAPTGAGGTTGAGNTGRPAADKPGGSAGAGDGGELSAEHLRLFARAFMHDAFEVCNLDRHRGRVPLEKARYNFALRRFRREHPWLAANPSNDIHRDFFNRNVVTNGARHLGGWSDTGDIVNADTIYYGWRTDPTGRRQILFIANMEGKPLPALTLRFLIPFEAEWKVEIASPGLSRLPERIDRYYVIENFANGEAVILSRELK